MPRRGRAQRRAAPVRAVMLAGLLGAAGAACATEPAPGLDAMLAALAEGRIGTGECRTATDRAIRHAADAARTPTARAVYWWGRCSEATGRRGDGARARAWLSREAPRTWWGWLARAEAGAARWRARGTGPDRRALIGAIIDVESAWNPNARSSKGAIGLMQVMPRTAAEVLGVGGAGGDPQTQRCLRDARCNAVLGQRYLNRQLAAFGTSLLHALAAYHGGPGNTRWARDVQRKRLESGRWGGDPALAIETWPVRETRAYLRRVLARTAERSGGAHPALAALGHRRWPTADPVWDTTNR